MSGWSLIETIILPLIFRSLAAISPYCSRKGDAIALGASAAGLGSHAVIGGQKRTCQRTSSRGLEYLARLTKGWSDGSRAMRH